MELKDGKNSPGEWSSCDWRKETWRGSGWDAAGRGCGLGAAFPGSRMPLGWNAIYDEARARYLASSQALLGAPMWTKISTSSLCAISPAVAVGMGERSVGKGARLELRLELKHGVCARALRYQEHGLTALVFDSSIQCVYLRASGLYVSRGTAPCIHGLPGQRRRRWFMANVGVELDAAGAPT